MPCLVDRYQHFGGACHLHLHCSRGRRFICIVGNCTPTMWRHVPEVYNLNTHCCGNLKLIIRLEENKLLKHIIFWMSGHPTYL